jgi:hypothetical protein
MNTKTAKYDNSSSGRKPLLGGHKKDRIKKSLTGRSKLSVMTNFCKNHNYLPKHFGDIGKFGDIGTFGDMGTEIKKNFKK